VTEQPLTLGTAGHIDHGKTALVAALTGVDTDRLPEEKARGISIELGYASLPLGDGRRVSVVDVPGHERFVRTMVAGSTGIDFFLLVVAADDGVMPQTVEHVGVLAALGVRDGVVAVTKADLTDPATAGEGAMQLVGAALGGGGATELAVCSARTGEGIEDVRAALTRVGARVRSRATNGGAAVLHVDRAFTIHGAGTVVTGTLWSGAVGVGDGLVLLPAGRRVRVRGVQVHDEPRERAEAGQRVALNLAGLAVREVGRGDVVAAPEAGLRPRHILDAELALRDAASGMRVHVHHGTRESPARLADLGGGFWQVRAERPLLAARGDRLVIRSVAPPDTLGGGVVLDPAARKHGPRPEVVRRLERLRRGEEPERERPAAEPTPEPPPEPAPAPQLGAAALELEERLRAAGHEAPAEADLGDLARELPALRAAGRAVRIGRSMYAHPDAIAAVQARVEGIIHAEGGITLARLRDELQTSRRYAQALLEHLDATRVTLRLPDDRRVLRRRGGGSAT
jgi:selenocysteine-specific elongation factor